MSSQDNTFNNFNFVFNKDEGVAEQISINTTSAEPDIKLRYDINTANPKTFKISKNGIKFSDNTVNHTTGLERLALVEDVFAAVELPPNTTTLKVKSAVNVNDGTNETNIFPTILASNAPTYTIQNTVNSGIVNIQTKDAGGVANNTISASSAGVTLDVVDNTINATSTGTTFTKPIIMSGSSGADRTITTNTVQFKDGVQTTFINQVGSEATISNTVNSGSILLKTRDATGTEKSTIVASSNGVTINSGIDVNNNEIIDVKNLSMDYTNSTSNTILLDQASNNFTYPLPNPSTDFQTRITKNTSDNLDICQLGDISLTKNITPSNNLNSLVVTDTTLLSSFPTTSPTITFANSSRAIFPQNDKVICSVYDNITFTKVIYIQDFNSSAMIQVDLTSLTTGANNYLANLGSISIAQIFPVYYNSATDCKFFIRLSTNDAATDLYLITCQGDPTQLSSYSYSTNFLNGETAPTGISNLASGASWFPLTSVTNAQGAISNRISIGLYDSTNDVLILMSANTNTGNRWIQVVNPQLTGVSGYKLPINLESITNSASPMFQSHVNTNVIVQGFNNNLANTFYKFYLMYCNPTTKAITYSLAVDTILDLPNQEARNLYYFDSYSIEVGGLIYYYYIWINRLVTSNITANLACYSWNKSATSAPVFVSTKVIQNLGAASLSTYPLFGTYYSIRAYDLDNIEVFSSWNVANNATMFLTNDNFTTMRTVTIPNFNVGALMAGHVECDYMTSSAGTQLPTSTNFAVVYPKHNCVRGTTASLASPLIDVRQINVDNPAQTTSKYLTFDYDLSGNRGFISSTKDITMSAVPLTIDASGQFNITNLATNTQYSRLNVKNTGLVCSSTNFYGQYIYTDIQAIPSASNTTVNLDGTVYQYGLSRTGNVITFNTTGLFKIGVSLLISNAGGSNQSVYFAFFDNVGAIANSGSVVDITASNSSHLAYAEIFYRSTSISNTISCNISATGINCSLTTSTGINGLPINPAVIMTIYQIE